MKLLLAATLTALALAACTPDTSKPTASPATTTTAATADSNTEARDAWKAFELVAPSFAGATDEERTTIAAGVCGIVEANDGHIATSVDEVNLEYGVPGTTRSGLLVMYATRWHCPEYLVDAGLWAEQAGLIEPN